MFLRFTLIILFILLILFIFSVLIPNIKSKYSLYKKLKEKEKRYEAFRIKMKELEIKWISNSLVILKKCRQKINQ